MSDRLRAAVCIGLAALCLSCCILGCIYSSGSPGTLTVTADVTSATAIRPEAPDGMIDINAADAEELTVLPGIGETIASRIVEEREKNGPFHYPEDLLTVSGIGENKLSGMLPLLLIPDGEEEK